VRFGGVSPDNGTWLVCTRGGTFQTRLRRIAGDGNRLDDVLITGQPGIEGDASAISRDGRTLFAWDPASATLTSVDTASGETSEGRGLVASADGGPLVALGRWLAPVAAAKSFLNASVVLSPDGSRVYALGVRDGVDNPENRGSAGVFVFDAATLELVGTYAPTADFVSLAIGPGGQHLYAAGLPGFDELGAARPDQGASVTVFDTAEGSVRLIAGQLGPRVITFGPEPLG
jgi:DNA-binding beta-propeller fold protein YncE